ncbi:hypothetical protein PSP6_360004 [Paraburkholderia tropica]|nr:hypothetical protein PSP6_360004 [Paraburkholderia tropica]
MLHKVSGVIANGLINSSEEIGFHFGVFWFCVVDVSRWPSQGGLLRFQCAGMSACGARPLVFSSYIRKHNEQDIQISLERNHGDVGGGTGKCGSAWEKGFAQHDRGGDARVGGCGCCACRFA